MPYYSRKIKLPFHQVVEKVTHNLTLQGFGIITAIDVQNTFKEKLNICFRNYKILGACNPQFAYKAISLESHMGILLPCNVVIQEHENGEVEVSAINPLENIGKTFGTIELIDLSEEIGVRLRAAVDYIQIEIPKKNVETIPPGKSPSDMCEQIHG